MLILSALPGAAGPPRGAVPAVAAVAAGTSSCSYGVRALRPARTEPYAISPREAAKAERELRRRLGAGSGRGGVRARLTVPTRLHLITDGRRGVSRRDALQQIKVLNAAYGGRMGGVDTGVRFDVVKVGRTRNRSWFADPLGNEIPMKSKLRRGGPETLNLFFAQLDEGVLGYSTYPFGYADDPDLDGVVIDWRSLPGGPLRNFDHGYTAVHEIGHWMGLFHTFENGCSPPGDYVADTPPEAWATQGCPRLKDSCPGDSRPDPIHNFMDYAHDRCMREFTDGQAERIHRVWRAFRGSPPSQNDA